MILKFTTNKIFSSLFLIHCSCSQLFGKSLHRLLESLVFHAFDAVVRPLLDSFDNDPFTYDVRNDLDNYRDEYHPPVIVMFLAGRGISVVKQVEWIFIILFRAEGVEHPHHICGEDADQA